MLDFCEEWRNTHKEEILAIDNMCNTRVHDYRGQLRIKDIRGKAKREWWEKNVGE